MTLIEQRARVGPDGKVTVPVGVNEAGREVIVTVAPAPEHRTRAEWAAFVNRTSGSIPDPSFSRPEQGEYEPRDGSE